MTTGKKSAVIAIRNLAHAIAELEAVWDDNSEGVDLNDIDAVSLYPFAKSLDEVHADVIGWLDHVKNECPIHCQVVKEWRALADDEFVDCETVEEFDSVEDAKQFATVLNKSKAVTWNAGGADNVYEYVSWTVCVLNSDSEETEYIEADMLGLDKSHIRIEG